MRTWLITGVRTGLGRAIAEAALQAGDRVVGTLRGAVDLPEFDALAPGRSHGVLLDVRDEAAVRDTVADVTARLGPIDVLVNNAGYGLEGAIEEVTLQQARDQFDVNVFGALAVTQAVLPGMRARRRGHVINMTSMGGLTSFAGVGIYNGSKFALEGISEALAKEVAPLGIKVTAVEPGAFRTDWAGRSMAHAKSPIADYDETAGAYRRALAQRNGHQPGDPRKAAEAILRIVADPAPPLHLLLGPDALALVGEKLGRLQTEIARWAPLSAATDFGA
jgi:NAD(P)-dependent dehydrogenase (short-subunit alcohol dehydrogenase family)